MYMFVLSYLLIICLPHSRMAVVTLSLPTRLNTLQVTFRNLVSSSKSNSNIESFRRTLSIGLNSKSTVEFRNILVVVMLNCGGGNGSLAMGQ